MAIPSPINVKKINKTAEDSNRSIKKSQGLLSSILNFGSKRIKEKKTAYSLTSILRERDEERKRREGAKSELTAQSIITKEGGSQQLVSAGSSSGFLERIIGFLGYLSAGWILRNLPTWIAMGKEFIARINVAGKILSDSFSSMTSIFGGIGSLLGAYAKNLASFDFLDTEGRVKTAMSELNDSFGNFQRNMEEALGLITTPLTQGKYSGQDVPPVGSESQDQGAYAPSEPYTGPTSSGGGVAAGAYDIASKIGANKQQWDIYRNTLAEIESRGRYDIPGGSGQYYDGRYQMGGEAKADAARILGIPDPGHSRNPNDPRRIAFRKNPELQERMFAAYTLANHGYLSSNSKYKAKQTVEQKLQVLGYAHNQGAGGASDWLNTGVVGSDGFNTKGTRYSEALARNFKNRINPYPNQQISAIQSPSVGNITTTVRDEINVAGPTGGTPSVGLTPGQGFGAPRWGRVHEGIDIGTSGQKGFYVAFKKSGKVVFAGSAGGYGNCVDIVDDNGVCYRFAHLAKMMVRNGEQYKGQTIGEIGSTGAGSGIHLHFEVRPGGPYGRAINPKPYLNLLSIGRQLSGVAGNPTLTSSQTSSQLPISQAQISPPPTQQRAGVAPGITPDRRPQDIVVYRPPNQQNIITSSGGGGSAPSSTPINDFDLLNNFIKNKLLLDLAYL